MINITTPNNSNTFFVKADSSSSEWIEQSSSTDWSDRRGHCCYEKDGTRYISGGQNDSVRFSDIWKSTDNGESWTLVTDTAPFGERYNHFVLELSGTLFLFGGSNIVEYSDVWSSEDGESWTLVTASWNISGLSSFGACVHNNKLCIAGGYKAPNYSDSFWTSEDGAVWTEVSSNIGLPLDAFNIYTPLFSFNGILYVLSHGKIHKSIDNGLTWSTTVDGGVSLSPIAARAITNGNSIYVSGGFDAKITAQLSDKLWTSEDGIVWTQQVMPCGKRYVHGVFLNSNGFTICGGASSNSPMAYENDIWVLLYLHHYIQCPVAEAEGMAVLRYIPVGADSVEGEVYAIGSVAVLVSPLTVVDGMNFTVSGTSVSLKGKTIKIQILDGATWVDCTGTAVIASDGTWSVTANATGITAGATKLRAVVGLTLSDEEDTTFEEVWIEFDALGTITAGTPYTLTGTSNRIGLHLDISQRVSSPEGSWTFIGQAAVQGDGTWSDEVTVTDAGTFDLRVEDADDSSRYDQIDDVVVASGESTENLFVTCLPSTPENQFLLKRLKSDLSHVSKLSTRGSGDNQFDNPQGIAVDDTYIYIADSFNNRILKWLKSDLSYVSKIGSSGTGNDQFSIPRDIAVDDTYVYIADTLNNRIQKRLKSDLSYVSKIGSSGTGNDQFRIPLCIAVDDTYIYITDSNNHRIQKRLKSDLSYVSKIGSQGTGNDQFRSPVGIAVDDTYIYIVDSTNNRIQKRLKSDLSYVSKIGSSGSGDDQFSFPIDIAVDDTYVYIADTYNDRIQKRLKSDLSYVSKIGSSVDGDDDMTNAWAIAVEPNDWD